MNILLVEDEIRVADFIRRGLSAEGWSIDHAASGEDALDYVASSDYDIVLLDLLLPGIQGQDVCRKLRARKLSIPILMLTALDSPEERVEGLKIGADDYLPKPFDFDELIARVEALHRRANGYTTEIANTVISLGTLTFDKRSLQVALEGNEIQLSKKERDLLLLFLTNVGRVLSRERILNSVWRVNEDPLTNVVDVYVGRLRRKIGAEGQRIVTIRNVGYRFA